MLDQSFSVDNFRKILDLENRKGVYLEKDFFPKLKKITEAIKESNKNLISKRKEKVGNDELKKIYEEHKILKEKKEDQLNEELKKVSENVVGSSFSIELTKKDIPGQKTLYIAKDSPEHYFTIKQVQNNVSRLFSVKQGNRLEIVSQVKALLNDEFPKYIIRTDIEDFYETIPHPSLLEKINGNNLLSPFSRKVLKQILNKYKTLSGNDKGVPRGIGVSANLSELYMRDIDRAIMSLNGISYYARYVDDIIVIFTPTTIEQNRNYLKEVKQIVEHDFKLTLNSTKTFEFDLRNTPQACELEYLGYRIFFGNDKVKTKLTDKKIKKYKNRIDLAFNNYLHLKKIDEKESRRLLVKRLRFLTGNTRLKNNKKNVLVGIFYSNCQLTEKEDLVSLDDYLRTKINTEIKIARLQERLKKYSFEDGFNTKRFSPFNINELQHILRIW